MVKSVKIWMVLAALLFLAGAGALGTYVLRQIVDDLPDVESLEQYVPPLVTNIADLTGQPIGEFFTERRTSIPLTQIPVDLRRAVMAIEDTDFYKHWGIDLQAILRASAANLRAGRVVQGGSTLSQQLAKTIFLTRKKTFTRKFKELLLTLQMEKRYSKDEILELYLNQIYFGGGAYGVEAAARLYFDKHTKDLNLPECALLAGLIRSPNRYSPLNHPERAQDRRSTVLGRMKLLNLITEPEEKEAEAYPISSTPSGLRGREAPYFLEEVRKVLEPVYGADRLEQEGLMIQTTLDLKMQRAAESILEKHLSSYDVKFGTITLNEYNQDLLKNTTEQVQISTTPPTLQGALVVLDTHTGAVRAMVGGRDFGRSQFNRAIQAKRQPGSSFKSFVWAAALEGTFTAATMVDDYPLVYIDMESDPTLLAETTTYAEADLAVWDNLQMTKDEFQLLKPDEQKELMKKFWRPQNYDGKYLGPLSVRKGLQKSRNLISIRLTDSVGPRAVARMARQAGIQSWLNPVLSLGLGTSVVSLLEMTNAYGTFATGGLWAQPYFIEKVSDRRGKIMQEASPKIEARVNPQTAYLITNLLRGVVSYGTGYYAKRLGRPLGGKTGTTQDQRDLLFIGFSPDLVCGVWMGYDDFRPLKKGITASTLAVPLWTEFMKEALRGYPVTEFQTPPKIEFAKIDSDTGFLALPTCPHVFLEAFREGTVPKEFCPVQHLGQQREEELIEE